MTEFTLPVSSHNDVVHISSIIGGLNIILYDQFLVDVHFKPLFVFLINNSNEVGFIQFHGIS